MKTVTEASDHPTVLVPSSGTRNSSSRSKSENANEISSVSPAPPQQRPSEVGQPFASNQHPSATQAVEPLEFSEPESSAAAAAAAAAEVPYPTGLKFMSVCVAIGLAFVLIGLDNTIIATAVPSITNDFKTITDIGWYAAAYRLTLCAFQFMFGKMYKIYSTKKVFLSALAVFELGSLLSGAAPTSVVLVVGRAIGGLGGAGIVAGVFTMATQSVPLRYRSVFIAVAVIIEEMASAVAPLLGGFLTSKASWRWCFYINLPLGGITLLVVGFYFEDLQVTQYQELHWKQKLGKLDLPGTAIFVPGIVAMLLALQFGGSRFGWGDPRIVVLFIVFATLMGVFGWWQWKRQDDATLPLRIIRHRSILSGMWFAMCNRSALSVAEYYMPVYLQAVKSVTTVQSGMLSLPSIIGHLISFLLGGAGISAVGYYTPFMLLTSIIMPVATGLLSTLSVSSTLAQLIIFQALLGFGSGIGWQGPQIAAQSVLNKNDASLGIAAVLFAQNLGPAMMIPVAQALFTQRLTNDIGEFAPGLNATALQNMGLSDLRDHIGPDQLQGALLGYGKAITQTFYLSVALACASVVGSLAMEWRSVKQKRA